MPPGPRASYAQPPPAGHPPRPSLARPPPPSQHKRDPSLTLPPLTTPSAVQPPSSTASGLEAMIMSIPVLNKVKILAQISPHLAPPTITSPPQEVRGSVVAIEGMDPTAVYSMTNSLAEELERDGKFAVRIFGGPDPYSLRDEHRRAIKRLSIAETLSVIGEWHKISEEMKRFITTKVSPTSEAVMSASSRKSVAMADAPPLLDRQKTPDRETSGAMTGVENTSIAAGNEKAVEHNASSVLSPGTVAQTADLNLTTPPAQRTSYGSRTPSLSGFPTTSKPASEDTPYTRIPAAAMQRSSSVTSPRATRSATSASIDKGKQFDTAPPPRSATSSQPPTPSAFPTPT
ncbi:MAG: hypothetical protein INR71_16110, partial [Terriglobus roseus]|nr:hypothetical protein [Terriglobus roseus]